MPFGPFFRWVAGKGALNVGVWSCACAGVRTGATAWAGRLAAGWCALYPSVLAAPQVSPLVANTPPSLPPSRPPSTVQAGVTAAFASDWPVVPLEPLGTLHAAVQRGQAAGSEARAPAGAAAAAEAEAVTYAEALRCHTLAGARAALLEQDLGAIRAGLLGDFAVLSATPESGRGAVRQTYVGGECAFGCGDDSAAD